MSAAGTGDPGVAAAHGAAAGGRQATEDAGGTGRAATRAEVAQLAAAAPAAPAAVAANGGPATADAAPGLERAFAHAPAEWDTRLRGVRGEVPGYVRGTCYSNGPGRFERGGLRYRHWLDGDGMVTALTFDATGVRFASRFVRSAKWAAEEEAGQALFRTFGTAFPGDRLARGIALEPAVNVSVLPWGGTLLALGEQGLPWALDPATLATRGPHTFGGGLNAVSPFGAHAKVDAASGELVNFGVSFSAARPALNLYTFASGGQLKARHRVALPYAGSMHDFLLTPRYAVFYLSPLLLDMEALARDGRTLLEALSWQPERGSLVLVVARDSGELVATVPVGARHCLHGINAHEAGGRLIADFLELDRPVYDQYQEIPDLFTDVAPGRPVRLVIDLAGGALVERRELPYLLAPDFPAIDPERLGRPCDDVWLLGISATGRGGRKFFDQLARLDWSAPGDQDVWQAPPGHFLGGDPVMVADPAVADAAGRGRRPGVVLCHCYDALHDESAYLLFDAFDLAAGPRAVLPLPGRARLGFHAVFAAEQGFRPPH
jgi:carotenoid cleavage dioxygenase-like enzyme